MTQNQWLTGFLSLLVIAGARHSVAQAQAFDGVWVNESGGRKFSLKFVREGNGYHVWSSSHYPDPRIADRTVDCGVGVLNGNRITMPQPTQQKRSPSGVGTNSNERTIFTLTTEVRGPNQPAVPVVMSNGFMNYWRPGMQPGGANRPEQQRQYRTIPAGSQIVYRGTKVYFQDGRGDLTVAPDGFYRFANGYVLEVRAGEKHIS